MRFRFTPIVPFKWLIVLIPVVLIWKIIKTLVPKLIRSRAFWVSCGVNIALVFMPLFLNLLMLGSY